MHEPTHTHNQTTLAELKGVCEKQFQGPIGYEFQHVTSQQERDWLLTHVMEKSDFLPLKA